MSSNFAQIEIDFLLVINCNLSSISLGFRDIAAKQVKSPQSRRFSSNFKIAYRAESGDISSLFSENHVIISLAAFDLSGGLGV